MRKILYVVLVMLIIACIFDPGDMILHMKVPLFLASWGVLLLYLLIYRVKAGIPYELAVYVFIILIIPFSSITYYYVTDGSVLYDGFQFFKAYLFITITLLLYIAKIDLIRPLCAILTLLSIVIISIFILTINNQLLVSYLYVQGIEYSCLMLGQRNYGSVVFHSIFYKTSPMIALAMAYFIYLAFTESNKYPYIVLAAINTFAMFLAGTRNNILTALCLPIGMFLMYSKHKKTIFILIFVGCLPVINKLVAVVIGMFSNSEASNSVKLAYLHDYYTIFSNPYYLLFGQGIGSYNYWSVLQLYQSNTELTVLEIFRSYGIFCGIILIILILYPLKRFSLKHRDVTTCLLLGYSFYLVMSFSNPLLFSSSGMLLLSIILVRIFLEKHFLLSPQD